MWSFYWGLIELAAIVAALVALSTTRSNSREIGELRAKLLRLEGEIRQRTMTAAPVERTAPIESPLAISEETSASPVLASEPPSGTTPPVSPAESAPAAAPTQSSQKRQETIERQFGGRAFVWLGGVALALAGFFLVKYSIDSGLLTENVRVVLGVLFGLALLAGSQALRSRQTISDSRRISQALAGAGIAVLYGSLFAATTLYHLLPVWLGFALMAVVTCTAIVLSLRHGVPIAALGLIGGYATPLMVSGEPNAPLLFAYLFLVFGGISLVVRRQNWSWLSIPATLVAFAWVVLWLFEGLADRDSVWLSLFLLGVVAVTALPNQQKAEPPFYRFWLRYPALAGALVLMATVTYAAHFSAFEWVMFGLISAATIVLAWFDDRNYVFAPWLALATNVVMLAAWQNADTAAIAGISIAFALLFSLSGQYLLSRSENASSWAGLSAASALAYYVLCYERLHEWLARSAANSADLFWAITAFAIAGVLTWATTRPVVLESEKQQRNVIQAIFAATATALLSIGFAILLHQEYLPFAIAAELLALSWIATRVELPALRYLSIALAAIYAALISPDILLLSDQSFPEFASAKPPGEWHQLVDLLFRIAIPGAMIAGAAFNQRKMRDDEFVLALESFVVAILAFVGYRFISILYAGHPTSDDFLVRALANAYLTVLCVGVLGFSQQYARPALYWCAVVLGGLILARIALFEVLIFNPFWTHEYVGEVPFLNLLTLAFVLPAASSLYLARHFADRGNKELSWIASIAAYAMAFDFVSLSVRQAYSGPYLNATRISDAEVYTYSAVWLACGVALLFVAVLRKNLAMRVASLVLMLLTVGKVFLYDASELTGLWRVVSFLGLGLCLLALSWFYSRFVFTPSEKSAET